MLGVASEEEAPYAEAGDSCGEYDQEHHAERLLTHRLQRDIHAARLLGVEGGGSPDEEAADDADRDALRAVADDREPARGSAQRGREVIVELAADPLDDLEDAEGDDAETDRADDELPAPDAQQTLREGLLGVLAFILLRAEGDADARRCT